MSAEENVRVPGETRKLFALPGFKPLISTYAVNDIGDLLDRCDVVGAQGPVRDGEVRVVRWTGDGGVAVAGTGVFNGVPGRVRARDHPHCWLRQRRPAQLRGWLAGVGQQCAGRDRQNERAPDRLYPRRLGAVDTVGSDIHRRAGPPSVLLDSCLQPAIEPDGEPCRVWCSAHPARTTPGRRLSPPRAITCPSRRQPCPPPPAPTALPTRRPRPHRTSWI